MQLKSIYRISFVLLFAITLTFCAGTTPASNNDGEGEDTEKLFCEKNPTFAYCNIILNNKKLKLEDAKPIQTQDDITLTLSWSDPVLYYKGFQSKVGKSIKSDFSIDAGSSLKSGDKFTTYYYFAADGSELYKTPKVISAQMGGSSSITLPSSNVKAGDKIIAIAFFEDKQAYLIMPPIEIIAK